MFNHHQHARSSIFPSLAAVIDTLQTSIADFARSTSRHERLTRVAADHEIEF
jgi:hypothetical protein